MRYIAFIGPLWYSVCINRKGCGYIMPIPSKAPEEKPKTARERVYEEVREWIVSGILRPGEKISDQEISKYFSVSRTPVREAIQMLADHRLVDIRPGRETRVSEVDIEQVAPDYRIMAELNALILEFAYPAIDGRILDELREIDAAFTAAAVTKDFRNASLLDGRFHNILTELADDHFLSEFTATLSDHIQRIENIFYQNSDAVAFESHSEIIDALEAKDLERAKEAMRRNWMRTLEKLL